MARKKVEESAIQALNEMGTRLQSLRWAVAQEPVDKEKVARELSALRLAETHLEAALGLGGTEDIIWQ